MPMIRTLLFVGMYALTSAAGDSLLSHGMKALAVLWIAVGIVFFAAGYGIFLGLLKDVPCSVVVPAQAASYVITVSVCYLFLGEHVPLMRWLGTFLVSIGVATVLVSDWKARPRVAAMASAE